METAIKIDQHQYPKRWLSLAESSSLQNFVCKVEFKLYYIVYPIFKQNDCFIALSVIVRKQ